MAILLFVSTPYDSKADSFQGTLKEDVNVPLTLGGKQVGTMTIKAGKQVCVKEITPNNEAVIVMGESTATISKTSLREDSLPQAVEPKPTITPQTIASPTPTPTPSLVEKRPDNKDTVYDATRNSWGASTTTITNKEAGPSAQEVNEALGINLFSETEFSKDTEINISHRVNLLRTSKTSYESEYSLEPRGNIRILGAKCFSLSVVCTNGVGDKASLIFANKGDIFAYATPEELKAMRTTVHLSTDPINPTLQMLQRYQEAIRLDKVTVTDKLTKLFGYGKPANNPKTSWMHEEGTEWTWRGLSFFLFAPRDEYLTLRIQKTPQKSYLEDERSNYAEAKTKLKSRVTHRPNGDVIIEDIPMICQGGKGYCVPASISRLFRYYGVQADMNMLAMAGRSSASGGTSGDAILPTVSELARNAGGVLNQRQFVGSIYDIKAAIDAGRPILWGLYSSSKFNSRVSARSSKRKTVTNWEEWAKELNKDRLTATTLKQDGAHMCMIIGYNQKTKEIAITDSWGEEFHERWMLEEEAKTASQGSIYIIE